MRAWIAFIVIGLVIGVLPTLLHRRIHGLVHDLLWSLSGSLLGGYPVIRFMEPYLARILGMVSSITLASLFLLLSQPGQWERVRSRVVQNLHKGRFLMTKFQVDRSRLLAWLAIYGALMGAMTVTYSNNRIPPNGMLMQTRIHGVQASADVIHAGGPYLLGTRASGDYVPVGTNDDPGIYLYLPWLMTTFHLETPQLAMKWLFIACFALLVSVSPLLLFLLFDSVLVALVWPFLLMFKLGGFLFNTDLYWIQAWVAVLCLPAMFALMKYWDLKRGSLGLFFLMVIASFATSIRIHAGLPMLVAAFLAVYVKVPSWRWRGLVAGLLVVGYLSIQPFAFDLVRTSRDHAVGMDLTADYPKKHPFWHNIYIGLGYIPNPYGIKWLDAVSHEAVRRLQPTAEVYSKEYEAILKDLFFDLARRDPKFVFEALYAKAKATVMPVAKSLGVFIAAFISMLWVGLRKREFRLYALLTLPVIALGFIPPVLTMPFREYMLGWVGGWFLLWALGVAGVLCEVRLRIIRT